MFSLLASGTALHTRGQAYPQRKQNTRVYKISITHANAGVAPGPPLVVRPQSPLLRQN